jgi:hypothetical protein
MTIEDQLKKLITAMETGTQDATIKQATVAKREAELKEFASVLVDNVKKKVISFDHARIKVAQFAQSDMEKSLLMFALQPLEIDFGIKTASDNTQNQGGSSMDEKTKKRLAHASQLVPNYVNWQKEQLQKMGWYQGTGDKVEYSKFDSGNAQKDQTYIKEGIKGGETDSREDGNKREEYNRASDTQKTKIGGNTMAGDQVKKSWMLGTGDSVDSNKWDLGVINKELAKMKENNAVGEQQRKEDETMKNESVVRASSKASVKLALDMDNKLNSQWIVVAKDTNDVVFAASLNDLLGKDDGVDTSKVPENVVNELLSPNYGKLIEESIAENGVVATAQSMVGNKKVAQAYAAQTKTAGEMPEGLKKYQEGKAGKKEDKKDEDKAEDKKEEKEANLETILKNASSRVKFYTLAGALGDIKEDAQKFKNADLHNLIKKAEEDLNGMKEKINGGEVIDTEIEEEAGDLEQIDQVLELLETGDVEGAKAILMKLKQSEEGEVGELGEEGAMTAEEGNMAAGAENLGMTAPKPELQLAASNKKQVKTAEEGNKKAEDYHVTPEWNIEKDFNDANPAPKDEQMKQFHTEFDVRNSMKSVADKKATGKLASVTQNLKLAAEGKEPAVPKPEYTASNEFKYISNITSPEYAAQYKKVEGLTQEQVDAQQSKEASLITKTKYALEAALSMKDKGLIKKSKEAVDEQFSRFMGMDEKNFNATIDTLEGLEPSTKLEAGRITAEALESPEFDSVKNQVNVARSYVDGVPVCKFSTTDLGVKPGEKISRLQLRKIIAATQDVLATGALDPILSSGKLESPAGVEVNSIHPTQESELKIR